MSTAPSYSFGPSAPEDPLEGMDLSGGFFVVKYSNGIRSHRTREHLLPFAPATGSGTPTYNYTRVANLTNNFEATVADTVNAYLAQIRTFFLPAWTFSLESLYAIVSGVPVEQFPLPSVPSVVGSAAGLPPSPVPYLQMIWTARTARGGRWRNVMTEAAGLSLIPSQVHTAGSDNNYDQFVQYVSSDATGIVAHDGYKIQPTAVLHSSTNRRLKRREASA